MYKKRLNATIILCAIITLSLLFTHCSSEPQIATTMVTIETEPTDAEVIILGTSRGNSPILIPDQPHGMMHVVLKKEGYKRTFEQVEVSGSEPMELHYTLVPRTGTLTLTTIPAAASVYLDDQLEPIGMTPLKEFPIPIGPHTYRIQLEGHYEKTDELEVIEDYDYIKEYTLKAQEGQIKVLSRPIGATIWINNQPQTQVTPARFTVKPGTYLISVHSEGYIQKEQLIQVGANAETEVLLKMQEGHVPAGMVLVPAGQFIRGSKDRSPDEAPQAKISLPAYYIDKYEVTNKDFKDQFPTHTFPDGHELLPATNITWTQANEYARAVGKRLPTEAEWEKAARGTDGREFPWGIDWMPDMCHSAEQSYRGPRSVGTYFRGGSPYGCMDMAGNVYEWTSDLYAPYEGNTAVNVDYGQVYRVLRGGSFQTPQFEVRCATRHFDKVNTKRKDYGFRCAMDAR